ncbi:MAG: Ppx/GppA phosphatase family protein [Deltaproteobacteria bacterium]|nr:Ppx/GppA phosphatase family protein [Deltaproteobacteria bacterium]
MNRIAAIDLGSLTVRLAVAEITGPGRFRVLGHYRAITALARGLTKNGKLAAGSMARTLKALETFAAKAQELGVQKSAAAATQAVRQAANREAFLAEVENLGIPVRVLSPEEEARLTLKGVLSALDRSWVDAGPLLVIDVGGGSSEFVLLKPGSEPVFAGLPLGVLTLSQEFPVGDPPEAEKVGILRHTIKERLQGFINENFADLLQEPPVLVGTAGTVTTLAALALKMTDYDPQRVNNLVLDKSQIDAMAAEMLALPEADRARLPGLEAAKAGVMPAGVLIIQTILEIFPRESLVVIDAGLLEGLLAEMAA